MNFFNIPFIFIRFHYENKRVYPEWFINELVNEEDKEKAMDGSLMNHSKIKFECDKGHMYEQSISHHIKLSTGKNYKDALYVGKLKTIKIG